MTTVGERIRLVRTSAASRCSQETFANTIGKTRPAIAAYELDKVVPDDAILLLISKTYGVCYDWLKNGNGPVYPPESDDLLVKLTHIMEGESKAKRELIELVADMPDALLDQLMDYYKSKQKKED